MTANDALRHKGQSAWFVKANGAEETIPTHPILAHATTPIITNLKRGRGSRTRNNAKRLK